MRGSIINIDREWCNILSVEYRTNNGKHYCESDFNYNLFCYRNQLQWLFTNSLGNGDCWFVYYSDGHCITGINLCRRIKHTHREWCNFLSMEHRADNS